MATLGEFAQMDLHHLEQLCGTDESSNWMNRSGFTASAEYVEDLERLTRKLALMSSRPLSFILSLFTCSLINTDVLSLSTFRCRSVSS